MNDKISISERIFYYTSKQHMKIKKETPMTNFCMHYVFNQTKSKKKTEYGNKILQIFLKEDIPIHSRLLVITFYV